MTFSDLYISRGFKVEILPTDRFQEKDDFIEDGDRFFVVFRPIRSPYFADRLIDDVFEEIRLRVVTEKMSIEESLTQAIRACNVSALNFLGNPEDAPSSGAMVLMIYIDAQKQVTILQIGNIVAKTRQDGKFIPITKDHTFGNKSEIEIARLNPKIKEIYGNISLDEIIQEIGKVEGFIKDTENVDYSKIPSRFVGHPNWCGWGEEYGESAISTKPDIITLHL